MSVAKPQKCYFNSTLCELQSWAQYIAVPSEQHFFRRALVDKTKSKFTEKPRVIVCTCTLSGCLLVFLFSPVLYGELVT